MDAEVDEACRQGDQEEKLPVGVGAHHGVVAAVGVAVEALCGEGALHLRVGGEEAAQDGVVEAGVHVDDAEAVVVLVAGEAASEGEAAAILPLCPVGGAHAPSDAVSSEVEDGGISCGVMCCLQHSVMVRILRQAGFLYQDLSHGFHARRRCRMAATS